MGWLGHVVVVVVVVVVLLFLIFVDVRIFIRGAPAWVGWAPLLLLLLLMLLVSFS